MAQPSVVGSEEFDLTEEELLRMERLMKRNSAASAEEYAELMAILQEAVDINSANQARTQEEEDRHQAEPVVSSMVHEDVPTFIEETNPPVAELQQQQPPVKSTFSELLQQSLPLANSTDLQKCPLLIEEIRRQSNGQVNRDQLMKITVLADAKRIAEERGNEVEVVSIDVGMDIEPAVSSKAPDEVPAFIEEANPPVVELQQQQPPVKSTFSELLQRLANSTDLQERPLLIEELLRQSKGQVTRDQLLEITVLADAKRIAEPRENAVEVVPIDADMDIESVDPVLSSDEEIIFLEEIASPIIFEGAITKKRKHCSNCNKIKNRKSRKRLHARARGSAKSSTSF